MSEESSGRRLYRDDELYTVAREVAQLADPDDPVSVSQREFDRHRAAAGHPDCPSARAICMRLGLGWRAFLVAAFEEDRDFAQTEAMRTKTQEGADFGEAHVAYALRRAAIELGGQTVQRHEYRHLIGCWLAKDRRRLGAHSILHTLLPNDGQIIRIAGSWDAGLALAGLEPSTPAFAQPAGVPVADAIDIYIELTGALPTQLELDRFARDSGFALARRPPGKKWLHLRREVIENRRAAGKSVPEAPLPKGERAVVAPAEILAGLPRAKRSKADASREGCIAALDAFDTDRSVKGKRTRLRYGDWVRDEGKKGRIWPWPSRFDDYDGYRALLEEARRRRREAA